jgi:hypothetical protein
MSDFLKMAEERIVELEADVARLKYAPGHFECPKCKFHMVSNTIDVQSGGISASDKPQECSNGCGPMWRVSWQDYCKDISDSAERLLMEKGALKDTLLSIKATIRWRHADGCPKDWGDPQPCNCWVGAATADIRKVCP